MYGRNAIGGAIIITTQDPADEFEATAKAGYGNENSIRGQLGVSGPIGDTAGYRATVNYYETDGFLDNVFLDEKADPVEDLSARLRFVWEPSDNFTGDLRFAMSDLSTKALYFVIPRDDEANPFSTFTTPPNANNVDEPIQLDDPGINDRDLFNASLKLDFGVGDGTLTSVTHYNTTEEILTGDAFDFRPAPNSIFMALLGVDLNQSQFLDIESYSQEIRYTSPTEGKFRWIAGAYFVHTDRFISTGNNVNDGTGVFPVYREPRIGVNNPSATFLADEQDNDAWAAFANLTFEISDKVELDAAIRYDEDKRENTTVTPEGFLPVGTPPGSSGQVRTHTWSEPQPKFTLRYAPTENTTIYGGLSRGFRSGGFNQTGVGAVADANGVAGVNDLFEAEVADTAEIGIKSQLLDGRLNLGAAAFYTESENGYFFVFLAANSTQNLGNLDARYKGFELEMNWNATDNFDLYASYGYTDSDITDMEDPTVIGQRSSTRLAHDGQRWSAVHRAGRRAGPVFPRRLSPHRPHLVGAVQHDVPRSDRHRGWPHRPWRGPVVCDALGQEPDRQGIQSGILTGRLPVQGSAAPLRHRVRVHILIGDGTWQPRQSYRTGFITTRTSRAISRRQGSSTRT